MLEFINNISIDTLVQVTSILVALSLFLASQTIDRLRTRKITRREIYQRLELASIELFRFECTNQKLIAPLWVNGKHIPAKDTVEYFIFYEYVCQILNLFEMATSFRKGKIIPDDVFGSWVIWYFELCNSENFPNIWSVARYNYTCDLREILDEGIRIASSNKNEKEKEKTFFEFVSKFFNCNTVKEWLSCGEFGKKMPKRCKKCASNLVQLKEKSYNEKRF